MDAGSYEYSFCFKILNDQDILCITSFEPGHNLSQHLDSAVSDAWLYHLQNRRTGDNKDTNLAFLSVEQLLE